MLQSVRSLVERMKLRRLERRGDVVELVGELAIPPRAPGGPHPRPGRRDLPPLLGLLAYVWTVRADRRQGHDPYEVLRHVRERAWLGYTNPRALAATIGAELPSADAGRRMVAYFGELAQKRSSYLFLPVVARIDRDVLRQR